MNVVETLTKHGISTDKGINKAVFDVSDIVNNSANRHKVANKIIQDLGAPSINDERVAVVYVKALVEQAVENQQNFNIEAATKAATLRVEKLFNDIPWAFYVPTKKSAEREITERQHPDKNIKKAAAYKIFCNHKDKTNHAIAKIIAAELNITYSNAFYYASRVFKR